MTYLSVNKNPSWNKNNKIDAVFYWIFHWISSNQWQQCSPDVTWTGGMGWNSPWDDEIWIMNYDFFGTYSHIGR